MFNAINEEGKGAFVNFNQETESFEFTGKNWAKLKGVAKERAIF